MGVLVNQIHTLITLMQDHLERIAPDNTREQFEKYAKEKVPEIGARTIAYIVDKYTKARNEIEVEVETMKAFYRSQRDKKAEMEGKTKADVLKEIWEAAGEMADKPLPPLDEEMLADLAEEPEAIDAFGGKYLLGVFETKEEAQNAFKNWNGEYEKARGEMKAELEQWGKQEQARLDRDTAGQERIKEVLENAKR